jgi:hypothetical protein
MVGDMRLTPKSPRFPTQEVSDANALACRDVTADMGVRWKALAANISRRIELAETSDSPR